jgi:DNA-binding response OmpR family regulator
MSGQTGTHQPLLALVVTAGGDPPAQVRAGLDNARIAHLVTTPGPQGWLAPDRPDLVVIEERSVDVLEVLDRALEGGRLAPAVPVLILYDGSDEPERPIAWFRAGAWDVIRMPVDPDILTARLTNMTRSMRPAAEGSSRAPYAWRYLVRVTDETLALGQRQGRPVACLAFAPEWRDRESTTRPTILAARLAATVMERARTGDVVGISENGVLLMVLPDTGLDEARILETRLLEALTARARELGVETDIRSTAAVADAEAEDYGDSAARFLLSVLRQAA